MVYEPELRPGTLKRRYKRFLADVVTADGELVTMHCPNTGAMTGCAEPDSRVWYSTSDNPKRKYAHSLELVETTGGERIGINSAFANALVGEALAGDQIPELSSYPERAREVPVPDGPGRFDFRLRSPERPPCFVEVKSVTLCLDDGLGLFPDARSERATRHARALQRRVRDGDRAVLVFCVQHTGIRRVSCAAEIDPDYARAVREALDAGVEVLAYAADVSPLATRLGSRLPFTVDPQSP
ncbi:MAG: DNA/RNA nuclease SfsA [Gammaproteobacteria bacterium]|nr:MAG: DNA/RNA nuclease SfsA [Gammaproteobacteria bacterium]